MEASDDSEIAVKRNLGPELTAFNAFVAIDWSGAKGTKHKGIAVALCRTGDDAPAPVLPPDGAVWSRTGVLHWLIQQAAREPTLFGFDFSFAPPLVERGAYLPGERASPTPRLPSGPMSTGSARANPTFAPPVSSKPITAVISISARRMG